MNDTEHDRAEDNDRGHQALQDDSMDNTRLCDGVSALLADLSDRDLSGTMPQDTLEALERFLARYAMSRTEATS